MHDPTSEGPAGGFIPPVPGKASEARSEAMPSEAPAGGFIPPSPGKASEARSEAMPSEGPAGGFIPPSPGKASEARSEAMPSEGPAGGFIPPSPGKARVWRVRLIPPIAALAAFGWARAHQSSLRPVKARPAPEAGAVKRETPSGPAGTSAIRGVLLSPNGAPAPAGIAVELAPEAERRTTAPSAWRCCPGCALALFDERCEQAAEAVAQAITSGLSRVRPIKSTQTEAGGRFVFDHLAQGTYAVWAVPPRAAVALAQNAGAAQGTAADLKLVSDFRASIEGSVVASADGQPIAGAAIAALDPRLGISFETTSDAGGRFAVEGIDRRESYYVLATASGMAPRGKTAASGDALLLELDDAAAVLGLVTFQGKRVPGVKVDLDGYLRTIETGPDGTFRFEGLAPGIHAIRASTEGAGHTPLGRRLEFELSRGLTRSLTIDLARACTVRVRVEGEGGEPLSGADVRLLAKTSIDHRAAKTDRAGAAPFDMLDSGAYEVDASRFDRGKASASLRLDPSCTRQDLTIMIRPAQGPGLIGRVHDERHTPLVGVEITVERAGTTNDDSEDGVRSAKSDAAGRFRVPALSPGTWQLTAVKEGRVSATASFEMRGRRDVALSVQLSAGGAIEGQVLDPTDRPVAGWQVSATIPGVDPSGGDPGAADDAFGERRVSGQEGSFRFTGLAHSAYVLTAEPMPVQQRGAIESGEARTPPLLAKIGERVVLRTRGSGQLTGRVRFVGAPPPESFTVAVPAAGVEAFEGETGRFGFDSVVASSYPIAIRAPGFTAATPRVSVPLHGRAEVNAVLRAPAALAGRLVDARDGSAIADATIASWLERKIDPDDDHPPSAFATSHRSGRFELDDLAPGEHLLVIRAAGYAPARIRTRPLEPGKSAPPVEIRLERAGVRIAGRVLSNGHAFAKALVMLDVREPKEGAPLDENALTDAEGRFVLDAVQPGIHALDVAARIGPTAKETVIKREILHVAAGGVDGLTIDLLDHQGTGKLVVELQGQRKDAVAVTLRPGVLDAKQATELDVDRLDAQDARVVAASQREVVFDRVPPGTYTVGVSRVAPLEDSLLGSMLARFKPLRFRRVDLLQREPESRVVIILD